MSSASASPDPAQMRAAGGSNSSPPASPIPDRPSSPDLPLTMTASMVLTTLPRDATAALAAAGGFASDKIVVRFKPVGSAPAVRRELCKISSDQKFETVVAYLRRVLRVKCTESVFLYVNSTFAPALDEVVGNLHRCFKDSNDQLNVAYSMTPAFG
ncbi:putative ubiquitin-like protein atg12 protein [Phaeoacremonium minimum UCRPA7]|uniref:Ubiquitin-like protein ATG12 n=1 Tax=Phaeoacremonium minimum (strain UCR-PA7) TaxID=1286976 RepID=R8BQY6_PHAM7|nr:putative ubiquitin-like protein atg12 protein [Phaeoacremonium minimum UCRPA7]EOO01762.1 putative ubiquitin-like protein atg12 protein [Phaeoacremonium minimum UCRPA7]